MGESNFDPPVAQPQPPRRRHQRPHGRWTNPASLLQAARFARKTSGKQVVAEIRNLCPGHGGEKCKIDQSKLSDYENLRRRPSVGHIETFCRYYQMSPEALGLITWRDEPETGPDATCGQDGWREESAADSDTPSGQGPTQEQLVMAWLRDSAVSITLAVVQALVNCPLQLTETELRRIIREALSHGAAPPSDDGVADADPPGMPAGAPVSSDLTTQPPRPDPHPNDAARPPAGTRVSATPEEARADTAPAHGHDASEPTE